MSSLARRTLRTTAAAGIAAPGAGIAGNAVTAPAESTVPAHEATSAQAALPLNDLSSAQAVPALPMLITYEGPTGNTSEPADASETGGRGAGWFPGSDQVPGMDAPPALDGVAPPGLSPRSRSAPDTRRTRPDTRHTARCAGAFAAVPRTSRSR
ncbi:MAG: hypothetical protein JNM77_19035, partial [Pseudonocardia sp.]|nr:hypothetical protein [Pseudonocardia sp.]